MQVYRNMAQLFTESFKKKRDKNEDSWWSPTTATTENNHETCILTLEEQLALALHICKKQLNNFQNSYGAISAVLNACIIASKCEGKDGTERVFRIIGHAALESNTTFTHHAWKYAMTRCLEIVGDSDSNFSDISQTLG
mmetsp:Transcript_1731/g.2603  ORF Transcript_1731/g.2603 Transcript_1731/m.2603 type:complete len:139 (-) Transcript_1731:963-1379(-)